MNVALESQRAIAFDCDDDTLVGILHLPTPHAARGDLGVIIVVGGPQYRVGSHRQFLFLARAIARAGLPVLRFDSRGMGDSTGDLRDFESISADIGAAIDALFREQPQLRRAALWGLCDGASAALLYLQERSDPRLRCLCLVNPWVRSDVSLARTHIRHYYGRRLLQRQFWAKLAGGKMGAAAISDLWTNVKRAGKIRAATAHRPFQSRMAAAWHAFDGQILLVLSGDDYTAKEFLDYVAENADWEHALDRPGLQRHDAAAADHTFSDTGDRLVLENITCEWLLALSTAQPWRTQSPECG